MNISKFENGNVVIPLRTTKNNDVEYCMVQQTGVQLFVEGNYVKLLQNGVLIGYILTSDISETQLLPAAPVSFDGTALQLFSILADEFFILSTDLAGVQAEVDALQVDVTALQLNQPEYVEVDITSAEILAMSGGIELLPAPGAGKYYDIEKMIFEYTHNTTAYTLVDDYIFVDGGCNEIWIQKSLITSGATNVKISNGSLSNNDVTYNSNYPSNITLNTAVTMSTGANPAAGDGTLKVKIWYFVQDFG